MNARGFRSLRDPVPRVMGLKNRGIAAKHLRERGKVRRGRGLGTDSQRTHRDCRKGQRDCWL